MSDMEGIYKEKLLTQIFNPLVEDKFYKSLKSVEMLDDVEEKYHLKIIKEKLKIKKLRTSNTESPSSNNLGSEINNQSGEFGMGKKRPSTKGVEKKEATTEKKFRKRKSAKKCRSLRDLNPRY